ncbi:MAG: LysE family translocator [Hyphomicrobiaceae bacterium]|nr:LysE family translocator [Hyphomicrobiaceae bacterium]
MDILALAAFTGVYFVAVSSPGPGIASIIARVMARGLAGMTGYVLGFVVGDLVWFTVAATGLAIIAQTLETLFVVIRYVGAGYLAFMAYKIWTAPVAATEIAAHSTPADNLAAFFASLTLTLGNPKVIIFFLSIMPLVVDVKDIGIAAYAEMAAIIMVVISATMWAYALLADRARRLFRSPRALKLINRLTAGMMGGVAVVVATR